MMPEERAVLAAMMLDEAGLSVVSAADRPVVEAVIAEAIRNAVAEEREANARLLEAVRDGVEVGPGGDCVEGCHGVLDRAAAAIRARGQAPTCEPDGEEDA